MDWNSKYTSYVLASYLISAIVLLGLTAYILIQNKQTRKKLQQMEHEPRD